MRRLNIAIPAVLLIAAFLTVGYAPPPTSPVEIITATATDEVQSIPGGHYRMHIPASFHPGFSPVVVQLPASGWHADAWEAGTGFKELGDRQNFVTVTVEPPPDGRWNAGMCCVRPGQEAIHGNDTPYVLAATSDAITRSGANPTRVFIAGGSGGAMKAWELICNYPGVFMGAGVVAGTLGINRCPYPTKVLQLHGALDRTIPFYGGLGFESNLGRPPFMSSWKARLLNPRGSLLPEPVLYPNVGHRWMPDATARLWAFFSTL